MSLLVVALLVAAPDHIDSQIKLPTVATFKDAPASSPVLTVNLTKHGEIRVDRAQVALGGRSFLDYLKKDGLKVGLRTISLDELGAHLAVAKRVYHLRQKRKGKSGYDRVAPGVQACGLTLDIRADRDAPLGHVLLLMTICAEVRYYKLRLAAVRPDGTTGLLDARLPVVMGIAPIKPVRKQHVAVSLLATKEKEAQWGRAGATTTVQLATAVTCSYAEQSLDWSSTWTKPKGRSAIAAWLRTMKRDKEASVVLVGEIAASDKVPVQQFASVLALFRSEAYAFVDFFATVIPTAKERKLKRIAYPVKNELPELGGDDRPEPEPDIPDDD